VHGARLTVRSGSGSEERCRIRRAGAEGNFPPRKALKSLETEKESRKLRGRGEQMAIEPRRLSRAGAPLALTHVAPGLEPSPAEVRKGAEKGA
jgi:hypothetical protein